MNHAKVVQTIPDFGVKPYLHLVAPNGTTNIALPAGFAAKSGDVVAVLSDDEWAELQATRACSEMFRGVRDSMIQRWGAP